MVELFADVAARARRVLADRAVARYWGEATVLAEMTVGGLAGHVLGVVRAAERRIELPTPVGLQVVDPAVGYAIVRLVSEDDLAEPSFRVPREAGERLGAQGHEAVIDAYGSVIARLEKVLAGERPDRLVPLPHTATESDTAMPATAATVWDYMVTRIVELVVHADDLAESVGVDVTPASPAASQLVIDFLSRTVRHRVGAAEMIRALAGRRPADTLRAL